MFTLIARSTFPQQRACQPLPGCPQSSPARKSLVSFRFV
jgi:hypothetical protein